MNRGQMDSLHQQLERQGRALARAEALAALSASQWDLSLDKDTCAWLGCAAAVRTTSAFCFEHRLPRDKEPT